MYPEINSMYSLSIYSLPVIVFMEMYWQDITRHNSSKGLNLVIHSGRKKKRKEKKGKGKEERKRKEGRREGKEGRKEKVKKEAKLRHEAVHYYVTDVQMLHWEMQGSEGAEGGSICSNIGEKSLREMSVRK